MRNALISSDAAAQAAGQMVLAEGGTAADAVVAATLAGAARSSPASLLGGAIFALAGPGVGAWMVDGRARVPGLGEYKRKSVPERPPASWCASVPGLVEAALATHVRFGTMGFGTLVRSTVSSVKEQDESKAVRARLSLLEALPRHGMSALARLGVQQLALEALGHPAGGLLTREDFVPRTARIEPLVVREAGPHEVLTFPPDVPSKNAPPDPATPALGATLAADMHGVVACSVWAIAPEAIPLATESGLSWPGLSLAPAKGVTRWRAGATLPMPAPFALLRSAGRAWAGAVMAGEGDLEGARDVLVHKRLAMAGVELEGDAPPAARVLRGLSLWAVRDGDDVRTFTESRDG